MSFCMHNSSFLAFQCISISTRWNLNFDPKWLRTERKIKHSYYLDHFGCPMWISYNLKMFEFHTNLLPKSRFRVYEVERIQNASKLLCLQAKAINDHSWRLFWDLDVVLHAQFEFPSNSMQISLNSIKPQFWSWMTLDQENNSTILLLRPFWTSHVNFVQLEDGRILYSHHPMPCALTQP